MKTKFKKAIQFSNTYRQEVVRFRAFLSSWRFSKADEARLTSSASSSLSYLQLYSSFLYPDTDEPPLLSKIATIWTTLNIYPGINTNKASTLLTRWLGRRTWPVEWRWSQVKISNPKRKINKCKKKKKKDDIIVSYVKTFPVEVSPRQLKMKKASSCSLFLNWEESQHLVLSISSQHPFLEISSVAKI